MKIFIKITFIIFCFFFISFSQAQKKSKSEKYIEKISKKYDLDKSQFYYISNSSDSLFKKTMQSSVVAFVKNGKSTSVDDIMVENEDGKKIPLNSCDANYEMSVSEIEPFLNDSKTYEGLVLRNIETQDIFKFPKDKMVSIVLFKKKYGFFMRSYMNRAKLLKEKEDVDYIFISSDLKHLKNLPDIWEDTLF